MSAQIQLITQPQLGLRAVIITRSVTKRQMDLVWDICQSGFKTDIELAKRWGVWAVLAHSDWSAVQRSKVPCQRPQGGIHLDLVQ